MKRLFNLLSLTLVSMGLSMPATAQLPAFPELRNEATLARAFDLPALGAPQILPAGAHSASVSWDLANEYLGHDTPGESLVVDGESQLLRLRWRQGLGSGLEWGLELPWVFRSGGVLDGPIESWHRFWGLPNGGREQAPQNRYRLEYRSDGQTLLDLQQGGNGIGDLHVSAGWQLAPRWALRANLQLPTGDADTLEGGAWGAAGWLEAALPFPTGSRWSGYVSAGGSGHEPQGPLASMQQHLVGLLGGGLGLRFTDRWQLLGQLYAHTALYEGSSLAPFGEALQAGLGLRYTLHSGARIDLGFQEDPITQSSPDFALHLSLALL
jgi:hypothetical protein